MTAEPHPLSVRSAVLGYGVLSYLTPAAALFQVIGFVGGLLLPQSLDAVAEGDFWPVLLFDAALLIGFALHLGVMARARLSELFTRLVPEAVERSTYVLTSSLALIAIFRFWQP